MKQACDKMEKIAVRLGDRFKIAVGLKRYNTIGLRCYKFDKDQERCAIISRQFEILINCSQL